MNGFLLGFLSQSQPETAYIHLVCVEPKSQGRGIATKLYERFLDAACALKRKHISLIVNPDNARSLDFHRRLGFSIDTTGNTLLDHGVIASRDYNGPGLHMVRFYRDI